MIYVWSWLASYTFSNLGYGFFGGFPIGADYCKSIFEDLSVVYPSLEGKEFLEVLWVLMLLIFILPSILILIQEESLALTTLMSSIIWIVMLKAIGILNNAIVIHSKAFEEWLSRMKQRFINIALNT